MSGTVRSSSAKLQVINHVDLATRASRSLSTTPRPFLRWAGSKRALLHQFIDVLPSRYRRYYEPFVGGASLFFLLRPQRACLSDSCGELIETYEAVRDEPTAILDYISQLKPDRELYYQIRQQRSTDRSRRAAEFIYLNKCCWNGLYRVNSAGQFNVPYGAPKSNFILEPGNFAACAAALQGDEIQLTRSEFANALADVGEHDLVFLDPPYVTGHNNNGFIDYNETLFSWDDQVNAAELAHDLVGRGAWVVVTNAFHCDVVELYGGFNVRPIERSSTIASASAKRGRVQEAVFWMGRT